jgi:hypothetical protein
MALGDQMSVSRFSTTGSILLLFGLTSVCSFGQSTSAVTAFSGANQANNVRMLPTPLSSVKSYDSTAPLQFPTGAKSSRAKYDADFPGAPKANAKGLGNGSNGHGHQNNNGSNVRGLITLPTFLGAFASGGGFAEFPYFMIGNDPLKGGTTQLPAKIVSTSLNLLNADGKGGVMNFSNAPYEDLTLNSPNFQPSDYTVGHHIQFGDAVQRAEFFNNMREDWHTVLNVEQVDRVTYNIPDVVQVSGLNVPGGVGNVPGYLIRHSQSTGATYVLMLDLLFNAVANDLVNNEINAGNYTTDAVNIAALPNTFLFSIDDKGVPATCCVAGFHTYFADESTPQSRWVFAYAGFASPGVFGGGFEDITALSHELSEALNDPFVDNPTPAWQFPGVNACQANLETGDPVEVLANAVFPVTLGKKGSQFTYHPQTEALLQWFEQGLPSDAIGGAYSYPDTTALTTTAAPCPF